MNKLFLKIATRYLLKNKLYSLINIFGLAIGIASFLLIMLYVQHERSYDKFQGSEQVYRVFMDYQEGGYYVPGDANSYLISGPSLEREFPEIHSYTRLRRTGNLVLLRGDTPYDGLSGSLADSKYFSVFDRDLVYGNTTTALEKPFTMVLDKNLAQKIFGDENPMGQTLQVAGFDDSLFTITGIIDNTDYNTHIPNDILVSFNTYFTWEVFEDDWRFNDKWNQNIYYTYLKVKEGTDFNRLNEKVMAFAPEGLQNERHHLEPVEDIHLYSDKPYEAEVNGNGESIQLLWVIAVITILLSWVNYMNLSSSKSLERAKEIGVRKVAGARRGQLMGQFLIESLLLNGSAIFFALVAVYFLLPAFNVLVEQDFILDGKQLKTLLPYLGIVLAGTLSASLYPAFVLSRFHPSKVLKSKVQVSARGLGLRKVLIIGQFTATIALLIGTFTSQRQLQTLRTRPIGAKLGQVVSLEGQVIAEFSDSLKRSKYETLIGELVKSPYVADASLAGTYPGDDFENLNSNMGITFPNGTRDDKHIWYNYAVDPSYFDVLELQFVAGTPYTQTATKQSQNVVVNEAMVRLMGVSRPESIIGETLKFFEEEWTISGVIENYSHRGPQSMAIPVVLLHRENTRRLLVKLTPSAGSLEGAGKALDVLRRVWDQVFPVSTYSVTFLDQNFETLFSAERKFAEAFQFFTLMAIIIASLGLFGLTSYTIIQRRKEIGIRKVNGATIGQILSLLNQDVVKWIGLAFVIAVPISWYVMREWLDGFAYKTELGWGVFALAGLTALMIALCTVSWQSIKAARTNPVEVLRDE